MKLQDAISISRLGIAFARYADNSQPHYTVFAGPIYQETSTRRDTGETYSYDACMWSIHRPGFAGGPVTCWPVDDVAILATGGNWHPVDEDSE